MVQVGVSDHVQAAAVIWDVLYIKFEIGCELLQ